MTASDIDRQTAQSPHNLIGEPPRWPRDPVNAAAVFFIFALIFSLLRSKDIFAVDGAFRCLGVYWRSSVFFHDNNHMLYPVDVLVWTRLLGALGFTASTRQGFYSLVELMNCLAAAGSLAIVFSLTKLATRSTGVALAATAGLAFTRAFLLHATNSAEPMVAVFWSLVGVALAALTFRTNAAWPIVASGCLFALALATYRSTIFVGPAAIVLIIESRTPTSPQALLLRGRIAALGQFALGGVVGCLCIYGWVFARLGLHRPSQMLGRFFAQEDTRVYFGIGIGKLLNLPIGLVRNVFPLQLHYTGIRTLLAGPRIATFWFLVLVAVSCIVIGASVGLVIRQWSRLPGALRTGFVAAGVGFLSSSIPLALWDSNYDKLWLQPLCCLAVLLGIAHTVILPAKKNYFLLARTIAVLLLAGLLSNILWAARSHSEAIPDFGETERLSHILGQNDLLVGEWDRLTTLYGYGWPEAHVFAFPSEAVVHGAGAVQLLQEQVTRAHQAGGKVYFLGLLDSPREVWDSFLGARCGVPYSELDYYRRHVSAPVATFPNGHDASIALRRLQFAD